MKDSATPVLRKALDDHALFIRRTLWKLGVAAREVEDVEQEVRCAIERGLGAFDPTLAASPKGALRCWIFGICQRQAATHRRVEGRRGEVLLTTAELDETQSGGEHAEERLIAAERRALLLELLSAVKPPRRAVVIAYEIECLPMVEVAAAQSIPVNTAWNRLRAGREELRAAGRRRMVRGEGGERAHGAR